MQQSRICILVVSQKWCNFVFKFLLFLVVFFFSDFWLEFNLDISTCIFQNSRKVNFLKMSVTTLFHVYTWRRGRWEQIENKSYYQIQKIFRKPTTFRYCINLREVTIKATFPINLQNLSCLRIIVYRKLLSVLILLRGHNWVHLPIGYGVLLSWIQS